MNNNPSPTPEYKHIELPSLSIGGQLFVWGMRRWQYAVNNRICMSASLRPTFEKAGFAGGCELLDEMMCHLSIAAFRSVVIKCQCQKSLSTDEIILLQVMRALQRKDVESARTEVSQMIGGRFSQTFLRISQVYIDAQWNTNLSLNGASYLTIVRSDQ